MSLKLNSRTRRVIYVHWSVSMCSCGQAHSLSYDWLLVYEWKYFCKNTSCNLVLLQGLYLVTACFIFVYQLDSRWDPYGIKYYYSTSPPHAWVMAFGKGWVHLNLAGCVEVIWTIPRWFLPASFLAAEWCLMVGVLTMLFLCP